MLYLRRRFVLTQIETVVLRALPLVARLHFRMLLLSGLGVYACMRVLGLGCRSGISKVQEHLPAEHGVTRSRTALGV